MDVDPNLMNVLMSVLGNGLTALIATSYNRGKAVLFSDSLYSNETPLNNYVRSALAEVAEKIQWADTPRLEEICLFLTSPDVETVVRQMYSANLADDQTHYLKNIKAEFADLFGYYFDVEKGSAQLKANSLFEILRKGTVAVLDRAIGNEVLSAHEAKSSYRHHQVMDELAAINKNLEFFLSAQVPKLQTILEFEKYYRAQVVDRHRDISPPFFDSAPKLPIEEAYVPPRFVSISLFRQDEEQKPIEVEEFLATSYRVVILGQPGGGKSTFTHRLAFDLSKRYSDRLFAGRRVTPFLVVLREYGADKKSRGCSIQQHIEAVSNSRYQLKTSSEVIKYILLNGRGLVVFDGLDELLDTSLRQEITSDVESFCNLYPSVPVVVTSREVGYSQAPLDPKKFQTYRLAAFDEDDVQSYVTNWFNADTLLTDSERTSLVKSFLRESKVAPDLRSNPLMLALICNIYRGEHYIPKNRPEVYKKCAEMLFERWDRGRNISVRFRFENDIRPALAYLAHWIYADEKLKGGVTDRALAKKATGYLLERRYEDRDDAERAAREFVEFCRGRAWVFTDTGTTRGGENLYQFTHTTFLEYFTALYLNRTHETVWDLTKELHPRIEAREWDVVTQLAYQIKSSELENAGDQLLTALVDQARELEGAEKWFYLSFAARSLDFIIPSPKVVRRIVEACLDQCIGWGIARFTRERDAEFYSHADILDQESLTPRELLVDLMYPARENLITIQGAIEKRLGALIVGRNRSKSQLSFEILLSLPVVDFRETSIYEDDETTVSWQNFSKRLLNSYVQRLASLCADNFLLANWAIWHGLLSLNTLIEAHDVEGIFRTASYVLFPDSARTCVAEALVGGFLTLQNNRLPFRDFDIEALRDVSRYFLIRKPPFISKENINKYQEFPAGLRPNMLLGEVPVLSQTAPMLKGDAAFGFFAIVASLVELAEFTEGVPYAVNFSPFAAINSLRSILSSRFSPRNDLEIMKEMRASELSEPQQKLVLGWTRRELKFTV
jgi:hypothetical protein